MREKRTSLPDGPVIVRGRGSWQAGGYVVNGVLHPLTSFPEAGPFGFIRPMPPKMHTALTDEARVAYDRFEASHASH